MGCIRDDLLDQASSIELSLKAASIRLPKSAEPAEVRPGGQVEGRCRGHAIGWTKSQHTGTLVLLTCCKSQGEVSLDTHISHIKREVWTLQSQKTHLVLRLILT